MSTRSARRVSLAAIFKSDYFKVCMVNEPGHVYVLELAEGRFYVGHTLDLYRRICQHFSGTGAVFTRTFKPVRILSVTEGGPALEKATFAVATFSKEAMEKSTFAVSMFWKEPVAPSTFMVFSNEPVVKSTWPVALPRWLRLRSPVFTGDGPVE